MEIPTLPAEAKDDPNAAPAPEGDKGTGPQKKEAPKKEMGSSSSAAAALLQKYSRRNRT
jgi:hypothetical protein